MNDAGFPNEYASPSEKSKSEYGNLVAKAILSQDENAGEGGTYYRKTRFEINERYATGLQDPDKYKQFLGDFEQKNDYMNLVWKVVNHLPPYITNAVDILTEGKYSPIATSVDPISRSEKEQAKARMIGNLVLKAAESTIFKDTDMSLVPAGEYIPASVDEVKIHEQSSMKSSLEYIAEITASTVIKNNDYETERANDARQLVVNKWACREVFYDEYGDIKIESFHPRDAIVPYSEDSFFRKRKFTGRRKLRTIMEIDALNNGVYSREELMMLAKKAATEYGNPKWQQRFDPYDYNQRWNTFKVPTLDFEWQTVNRHSWIARDRKNGGRVVVKDPDEKELKQKDKKSYVKNRCVYYDGIHVIGTDKMLKWELRRNMPHDGDGLGDSKPLSRFIITAPDLHYMRNRSIPESAEYALDQIVISYLKLQHLVTKITPPKIAVNAKALQDVHIGLGLEGGKPMDATRIYEQIGILYHMGGEAGGSKPVEAIPSHIYGEVRTLVEVINFYRQSLEDEIGLDSVITGTNTDRYEGYRSRMMKEKSSVRSLSNLQKSLDYMDDQTIKIISSMIKQSFIRNDWHMIKGLKKIIGQTNIDIMKIAKFESLSELGIEFKMLPTEQEIERLEYNIQQEINLGTLTTEAGEMILNVAKTNIKGAMMLAAVKREEIRKKRLEEAQMNAQMNGQEQQNSLMVKAEVDRQTALMEHKLKMQMEEFKSMMRREEVAEKHEDNIEIKQVEGENKIEQIREANVNNLDDSSLNNTMRQPKVYP